MPRFVILEHDHPSLHWDLMLEVGDVLRTWRLALPPAVGVVLDVQASFDHRLAYLDYEGPISSGRGQVMRWDYGEFAAAIEEGRVVVQLYGARLRGMLALEKVQGDVWRGTWTPAEN